ncbi:MAG: sigma-54 interaction domain-containing protein [Planctomycetota bacterium]
MLRVFHCSPSDFPEIIGRSPKLLQLLKNVGLIADTKATVLIEGETGTGKEQIAEAIHARSRRSSKIMTSINCGAIPENLLESEFFGYAKGAFTGADKNHKGRFEISDGSTVFLDEIDELHPNAQVKLLRVLQKGEFTPLGTHEIRHSDVRIVAATNRNLKKLVEKKQFRQDLYYRLCIVNLRLPALRERKEDLPLLIEFFLRKYCDYFSKTQLEVSRTAEVCLKEYNYPGNIRELENIMQHAVLLCQGSEILPEHLPLEVHNLDGKYPIREHITYVEAKRIFERSYFEEAMTASKGVIRKAARRAGLDYKNFYVKMKSYRIDPLVFKD